MTPSIGMSNVGPVPKRVAGSKKSKVRSKPKSKPKSKRKHA
jgi:hypothetical protein